MEKILIIGCGGVGGVTAAKLARAGHRVSAVTSNPTITEAINHSGLIASCDDDEISTQRIAAHTALDGDVGPFDIAFLAVPPNAVKSAVTDALPFLTDDAPIVCLPNGLVEEHVSDMVSPDRVVGGIVEFGARMLGPGRVVQTAPGGITIGRLARAGVTGADPLLESVAELLDDSVGYHFADNLEGARWSKLAINCAISSLGTVGGDRLGVLMRHRFVRRLALEVMTEVVAVAQANGVDLEKVAGTLDLDWLALDDDERLKSGSVGLFAKHSVLLLVGTKFRKMRSSMLAAIERGRKPPVDFLNGEIVTRGAPHGIPTPVNDALHQTVHAIARGEQTSSVETLRRVWDETRDELRELELAS
jgi:2-dehydropantoate 2-reductase